LGNLNRPIGGVVGGLSSLLNQVSRYINPLLQIAKMLSTLTQKDCLSLFSSSSKNKTKFIIHLSERFLLNDIISQKFGFV
jgi:hypothetical protein